MFDYTVFIGRFQPFHNGHLSVVHKALEMSDRLILLIGSANRASDFRNPWSYEERKEMISQCLSKAELARVFFAPIDDFLYQSDSLWIAQVQRIVDRIVRNVNWANINKPDWYPSIALIGHNKDHSSYYLKKFPQWKFIDVKQHEYHNATDLRFQIFSDKLNLTIQDGVPEGLVEWFTTYKGSDHYNYLVKEFDHIKLTGSQWKVKSKDNPNGIPYPVIFHTTDAVVTQSGHILLVKRANMPGEGRWALPGGFLEPNLTQLENMLKELKEECRLKVPVPVLLGSLKAQHSFDDPHRSSRGRTVTQGFYFPLTEQTELPQIKAGSDAAETKWELISNINPKNMMEDHNFIINYFLNQ